MGYCFCNKSLRMKKIAIAITLVVMVLSLAGAQKPVAQKALALFDGKEPQTYSLFTSASQSKEDAQPYVSNSYTLTLNSEIFRALRSSGDGLLRLTLPSPFDLQLDLYRAQVFSEDARIRTSDGQAFLPNPSSRFYRGIIHDNPKSLAIVSVFEDHIQIIFSDQYGNTRIQQTEGNQYILFKDQDILIPKHLGCFADDCDPSIAINTSTTKRHANETHHERQILHQQLLHPGRCGLAVTRSGSRRRNCESPCHSGSQGRSVRYRKPHCHI